MPKKKPSAKPSGPKAPTTRGKKLPQPHGGHLVSGAGGGPQPGSGRPPDVWRQSLREMADRQSVRDHVLAVLDAGPTRTECPDPEDIDPDTKKPVTVHLGSPHFGRALEYATEHGYGRAMQTVALSVTIDIAERIRAARERAKQR